MGVDTDARRPLLEGQYPSIPAPSAPLLDNTGNPALMFPTPYNPVTPMPHGYPNPYEHQPAFYPPVQGTPVFPSPTAGPPSSEHGFLPPAPDAHVIHHTHLHIPDGPVITRIHSCPRLHVCPRCGTTGPTVVRRESGCCAYLACFSMCWLFCPLFWLPFCLDCDRDLVHRCGKCRTEIARIKPC
eukprot:jgi/Chrzof1/13148/Cz07g21200.t1